MKVLVIGASGQLGSELCRMLDKKGIEYLGTNSKDLDITDWNAVNQYFKEYRPQLVYNCAAYTNVDGAEDTPGKIANYKVNVIGTENVAAASEKFGATLIYISTDYVFDGNIQKCILKNPLLIHKMNMDVLNLLESKQYLK